MTAALEGGQWSAARPGRNLRPGKTRYPFYRTLGGPQGRSGRAKNLVPTGIRSRTVQPGSSVAITTELPGPPLYVEEYLKWQFVRDSTFSQRCCWRIWRWKHCDPPKRRVFRVQRLSVTSHKSWIFCSLLPCKSYRKIRFLICTIKLGHLGFRIIPVLTYSVWEEALRDVRTVRSWRTILFTFSDVGFDHYNYVWR